MLMPMTGVEVPVGIPDLEGESERGYELSEAGLRIESKHSSG